MVSRESIPKSKGKILGEIVMCSFYLDDEKFRQNLEVLMGVIDRKIHKAIELDQLIILQVELLQQELIESKNAESGEALEAVVSRAAEIGSLLQEIRKKLHEELFTIGAIEKDRTLKP